MKLTTAIKERIIKNIMADTFGSRESAIKNEYSLLADDIYADTYGPYAKKMAGIPEGFFLSKSYFDLRIEGDRFPKTLHMSTTRLFGKCHDYSAIRVNADSEFAARHNSIERKCDSLNADMLSLKATLNSVILPITTDKRLAEVWPDAEKWIPRTPAAMSNLPAVRPEDLNAMIGKMKEGL